MPAKRPDDGFVKRVPGKQAKLVSGAANRRHVARWQGVFGFLSTDNNLVLRSGAFADEMGQVANGYGVA